MAVRTLSEWSKDNWPGEAIEHIEKAIVEEPEVDVRNYLENVLAGRELDQCLKWSLPQMQRVHSALHKQPAP